MAAKPKLTPEQWASTRATWEADPREGYAWLVDELALPVSAPGVRKTALKDGWSKANALDSVAPKVKVSKVSMVSQKNHAKVSPSIKETMPKTMSDDEPVETVKVERGKESRLTPNQERFKQEYLIDLNATRAYLEAHPGSKASTARTEGSRYLANPNIAAAISAALDARADKTGITAEWVVAKFKAIAEADARELVQVKVGCCRHCYGEGHKRQRTVGEMNCDREAHVAKQRDIAEFDEEGGIGFDPLQPPHKDCPECGGDGQARTVLMDTRTLSPGAAALYAGAKQTKFGIDIQMHSKSDALDSARPETPFFQKMTCLNFKHKSFFD